MLLLKVRLTHSVRCEERLLRMNMPIQQMKEQNVSFIVHLKRLFPTAQKQEDYFKSKYFLCQMQVPLHSHRMVKPSASVALQFLIGPNTRD